MEDSNNLFEDNENEILNMQEEAKNQERISAMRDQLARANYNSIITNGIDVSMMEQNTEQIKKILRETLLYFESLEEYEKCAKLKDILDSF